VPNPPFHSGVHALVFAGPQIQKLAQATVEEEVLHLHKVERRSRRVRPREAQDGGWDGEGNDGDEKDDEKEYMDGNRGKKKNKPNGKGRDRIVVSNVVGIYNTATTTTVLPDTLTVTSTLPAVSIFTTISFTATSSIDILSATPSAPPPMTSTVTATIPETIALTNTNEGPSLRPTDLFPHGSLSRDKPSVGVIVGAVFASSLFVILIPLALWIMRHIRRRLRVASSEFTIVVDGTVRHPFSRILSRPEPQMVERGPISPSSISGSFVVDRPTLIYATPLPGPPSPFNDSYQGSDPLSISTEAEGLSREA